jgi:hypothetical protein
MAKISVEALNCTHSFGFVISHELDDLPMDGLGFSSLPAKAVSHAVGTSGAARHEASTAAKVGW